MAFRRHCAGRIQARYESRRLDDINTCIDDVLAAELPLAWCCGRSRGHESVCTDPARARGGLANLDERALDLGGSFEVGPGEAGGTTVVWRVPADRLTRRQRYSGPEQSGRPTGTMVESRGGTRHDRTFRPSGAVPRGRCPPLTSAPPSGR